ncbi:MAG: S-layer homology domain-containing protein [Clostridiales bacterium]|nr:S-layer homology domain-containing protein [Clostridiales bacterium]
MKKRRLLAWVLALAMMVSSISITSFAEEAEADTAVEETVSGSAVEASVDEVSDSEETEISAEIEAENADLNSITSNYAETQFVTAGDWQAATFGNSCDTENVETSTGYKNWVAASDESTVTMHAEKGKIGDGSATANSEGIVFYYQPVAEGEDFTISATATVNDYTTNNQVAFGLQMRDQVFDNMTNPSQALGASVAAGVFRLGSDKTLTGVLGASGYYYNDEGLYISANKSATYPTDAALFTGSGADLNIGDEISIKLQYTAALGMVSYTVGDISQSFYVGSLETAATFSDEIYVGPFVAREADVTFSNLKLTVGTETYEAGAWTEGKSYIGVGSYTITPKYDGDDLTDVSFAFSGTNKGKLSPNDEEYPYIVSSVSSDANFELSAHVKIDEYLSGSNMNQTAFGIVFRDNVDMDSTYSADMETNSYTAGYTDSTAGVTYPGTSSNRISPSVMLSFVNDARTSDPTYDPGATIRLMDKSMTTASHSAVMTNDIAAGDEFDITLKKSGDSYKATIVDANGNTYSNAITTTNTFGDTIYPGFFAARNVCVTYSDIDLFVDNRVVESIQVTTPPTQTEYYYGETINTDGMVVTATYDDGSTEEGVDFVATIDTSVIGDGVMTVVVGSATTTTPITVRKKYITSVDLTYVPIIDRYYEYQLFNTDGIEGTFTYEDGTTEAIASENVAYIVDGKYIDETKYWLASDKGTKTVYVTLAETDTTASNNVTASFDIRIMPYTLSAVNITTNPYKTEYSLNEELELDGIYILGEYTDGTSYYYETIYEDAFTFSGFSSAAAGTVTVNVILSANPSIKASFICTVSEKVLTKTEITKYPRTTFPRGTSLEDIETAFVTGTVITKTYSDESEDEIGVVGSDATDLTSNDYVGDYSEVSVNTNGDYVVTLTPVDTSLPEFEVSVTIWDDKTFYWRACKFGATSGNSSYSLTNVDETGLAEEAQLTSWDGAGKVTNSGHDGIVYYYTRINADNNFTISGDVYVNKFLQNETNIGRYGQEAFGIMARDVIPLTPASGYSEDSETYEGYGTSVVVETQNAKVDEYGEPVPSNTGSDFFSNVVLVGGFPTSSYKTGDAATAKNANNNRMKLWIRTGMYAWDGTSGSAENLEYLLYDGSEFGDYLTTDEQFATGECFYPQKGDQYNLVLSRINGGYYVECTLLGVGEGNEEYSDLIGTTWSYAWDYSADGDLEDEPLTEQNDDTIYAGFFAARWADINVTNINVYESSTDTDANSATGTDEVQTPSLSIVSDLYTTNTNYSLMLKAANDSGGRVIIKLDDEVLYNGYPVTKKVTSFDLDLEIDTKYDLTICYTPSSYDDLTTYDTITYREKLYCLSGVDIDGNIIYAAPVEGEGESESGVYGSFTGKGTIDSPLNIDAALAVIEAGQEIVLLNGTYYRDETISITETNYGNKAEYKKMSAETDREVIIDMQRSAEGLNMAGDCWWIKGLVIRNSAVNSQGGGVSAQNCIVENCVFEDSGSTGFQISGNSSDTFDLWPANNLIINCESFNSSTGSAGSADGFGCKLTVGNGNIFKGCVSHNNDDDGWDLYTKTSSGAIGAVLLEDCISYNCSYYLITENNVGGINSSDARNQAIYGSSLDPSSYSIGDQVLFQSASSSGNGFKLGGENTYVQHYIKDSYAFSNKQKGFDSNSNPAMKVRNCVSFHNGNGRESINTRGFDWTVSKTPSLAANYGLYSGVTDMVFNYNLDGAISVCALTSDNIATYSSYLTGTNQADSAETLASLTSTANSTNSERYAVLTLDRSTEAKPVESEGNYLVKSTDDASSTSWGTSAYKDGYTYTGYAGYNSEGEEVTPDWFVSLNEGDAVDSYGFIAQNADGTYNMNGFLELTSAHTYTYETNDIPIYNDAYLMYFGITNVDTSTDSDSETTTTAHKSSGGGSGGGSSSSSTSAATTTTAASTDESDSDSEATTSASSSSSSSSSGIAINPPTEAVAAPAFEDIANKTWAVSAIEKLASLGIINGVTETLFCPDNAMTRGDFCVLITKLLGLETSTGGAPYSDVSASTYYASAIAAATNAGIAQGYGDGTFKPSQYITRQEMFVLIAKSYEAFGVDISASISSVNSFADSDDVAEWAAPYAAFLIENGLLTGNDEGKLNPGVAITRAETAVLLEKVYDDALEFVEAYNAMLEAEAELEAEEAEEADEEADTEETEAAEAEETDAEASEEETSETESTDSEAVTEITTETTTVQA